MDDGDIDLRALGERLRALRADRGASLGEMAQETGLSSSFLSLVENGRSDISTGRLLRVARFLGVGIAELLEEEPPGLTVVRAQDRRPAEAYAGGLSVVPLVDGAEAASMAATVCEYDVGAHVADLPAMEGAEHFVFVTDGRIEIALAQGGPVALGAGDSAYIRSLAAGSVRNLADRRSVAVWVSSPPVTARARATLLPGPATG
ncbi:helix-turn-helix domain-containing protein [Miltoncostaea marina]|uniref:helix-turn-helix domain-containing protein n=1 Tax=Miltoncostaea marina TaxID=2843215 RepID=UPI001C3C6D77|nr:helix-turn-helix domain-containing protein [Miltoncostaea marina]